MKIRTSVKASLERLSAEKGKYLLAFSGGPDSVYLLENLASYYGKDVKEHLSLAYVDYHDSEHVPEEEKIVLEYQQKYSLTLYRLDVNYKKEYGNFEDWARKVRYGFFKETCLKNHLDGIYVAHQLTDHVETYLLQKKRGNLPLHYGLNELSTYEGVPLLRPLLSVTKKEILSSLEKERIPYYDDCTNLHTTRYKIRKEISEDEIHSYQKIIQSKNRQLEKLYVGFSHHPNGMEYLTYTKLKDENKRRYLFYLLDNHSVSSSKREGLGKRMYDFLLKRECGKMKLEETLVLYRTKEAFFVHAPFEDTKYSFICTQEGRYENDLFEIELDKKTFNIPAFPIEIRNFQEGDKIATNLPRTDVKAFLKKEGVPSFLIPAYPVFLCNEKIFYVPFYKDIKAQKIPFRFRLY